MKESLKKLIGNKKSGKFLLIAGIVGILLIYLSTFTTKQTENKTESKNSFSVLEYEEYLEKEIGEIVSAISGDTSAVVTVTLDCELSYVYADEVKQNNQKGKENSTENTEQTYITVTDSEGGENPLIVTAYMPKVRGVAIVCRAQNQTVIDNIEGAVMAALDITSRKIFISDKKGE